MLGVFIFWAALCLPGYALLRRIDRAALQDGALSTIARSYLATFAVLTPVAVVAYALQLPLAVLSTAIVIAVCGACVLLARDLQRPLHWSWPSPVAALCTAVLITDVVLGARVGTYMGGDAGFHVGRARMLLDHGFNNWDPVIAGHHFERNYHSNLYHALLASCAQLAHVSPAVAWLGAWPWAKVLSAASAGHLAIAIFRERWVGWLAATLASLFMATTSALPFPNTIAAYWLLSMGLAFAVDALTADRSFRSAAWLAVSAAALAQVHELDAVFLTLLAGPCLAAQLAWRSVRRLPGRRQTLAALLALGLSVPWLVVPVLPRLQGVITQATSAPVAHADPAAKPYDTEKIDRSFVRLGNGMTMADPMRLIGLNSYQTHLLVAVLLGLASTRRRHLLAPAGILLVTCIALYFPPACTLLLRVTGAPWILWRIACVFTVLAFAITPVVLPWLGEPTIAALSRKIPWRLLGWCAAAAYGVWLGAGSPPFTRQQYWEDGVAGKIDQTVERARGATDFLDKHIGPAETIAAPLSADYRVTMYCNCYVLAPARDRGARGVGDMSQRRDAIDALFDLRTAPDTRLSILRHYGLRHVYIPGPNRRGYRIAQRLMNDLRPYVVGVAQWSDTRIITFDLTRAP
jgi:hypothetical protein